MKKWSPDEIILREKAPLFKALSSYVDGNNTSFHMPATRPGVPAFSLLDVTELAATDDLNEPKGAVLEAQNMAAQFFVAAQTRFLTEGSSQGIFASLLVLAGEGGTVLFPRAIHRAFMYAAQRFSLDVHFALPSQITETESFTPLLYPSIDDYEKQLIKHREINVVVVTAPDYYGHICDLAALEALCQKYRVRLLVDAAHGAHLHLLPAWRLYGDIVIESAHKTLPSVTPSAYLHICEKDNQAATDALAKRIDMALKVLRTSSPPLYVAAAADWARAFLKERGSSALARQKKAITWLQTELPEHINMIAPLPYENQNAQLQKRAAVANTPLRPRVLADPLRLVLDVSYYMSGNEMAEALARNGVQVEFSDLRRVILIPSLLSEPSDYLHLSAALSAALLGKEKLSKEKHEQLIEEDQKFHWQLSGYTCLTDDTQETKNAKTFLSGKALHAALQRSIQGLEEASDSAVIPYPPGIPMYWPTELR